MTVYLIRHGKTEANEKRLSCGSTDLPLSEKGREELSHKDIYPACSLGCKTVWLKNICWTEEPVIPEHEPTATIATLEDLPHTLEQL